ncbi:unnamed protein product [Linum tenue]|uniref:Uncharacterized protein n=1 Tax=Linum tenue TaxID=586396 RepID=A0AAV0KHF9_9ROSI|nr:unnamed protein product [Linum tenue]
MSSSSRFVVNSNSFFLSGTGDGVVAVVDTVTDLNSPSYASGDWKIIAAAIGTITTTTISSATIPAGTKLYRGLEIFGAIIEGSSLDKLCKDLFNSQLLVNRDGYQIKYYDKITTGGGFVTGSSYMVKLNNMLGWEKYGVKRPATAPITAVWNRYDVAKGEVVVDYVAAEERRREMDAELGKQRRELGQLQLRLVEKEEILGHYQRILEESKELLREKESAKQRLREVIEEKNRVVEEQSRVIKEKEMEIQRLKLNKGEGEKEAAGVGDDGELKKAGEGFGMKEKVVGDDGDEFKAPMDSFLSCCAKDLKVAIIATNRAFFVNVVLSLFLACLCFFRLFG